MGRILRKKFPALVIVTDVCLCAYTKHGHCGILDSHGEVDNDATNEILAGIAVSHAKAGADIIISYWANQYNKFFKDQPL